MGRLGCSVKVIGLTGLALMAAQMYDTSVKLVPEDIVKHYDLMKKYESMQHEDEPILYDRIDIGGIYMSC